MGAAASGSSSKSSASDPSTHPPSADSLKASWVDRQFPPAGGNVVDVIRQTGWLYSAGGECHYLALHARGCSKKDADRAIEKGHLVEVKAVRGCTMLLPREDAKVRDLPSLAERFLRWAAPATLAEFAWWAGVTQKAARSAFDQAPTTVRPTRAKIVFLPVRDNYLYFRRDAAIFADAAHRDVALLDWENRPTTLSKLHAIHNHAIVESGRLIGVWDYDPETREVVWATFGAAPKGLAGEVAALKETIEREYGRVRIYHADRGAALKGRLAAIRKMR